MIKREKVVLIVQNVRSTLYAETKTSLILVSIKKDLKRVLDSWSENADEVFQDGMGAGFLGEYGEAIEFFDRINYLVVGVNETKKNAWFYKAVALGELGKHEEAITTYKEILEWDKNDPDALNNIGYDYAALEKFKEAIEYYNKCLEFEPERKESLSNKADALCELEKFDEALDCVNKSLDINPNFISALETKSDILVGLGKFKEAIEISKKIIEFDPEDYVGWGVLGTQYLLVNNLEKSLECFEKSQKLDLSDGTIWYNKACVLSRLGREEESLDALFVATSIEPENLVDLRNEKDFENIKKTERFQKLLSRLV